MTSLRDVKLYTLKTIVEPDGNLVALESNRDIPFLIKRIFSCETVYLLKITNNLKLRAGVCRKLVLKLPS